MKMTFMYRQAMVNNEAKSSDVFLVFPRFLDTPGLIEQDFCLVRQAMANKFLEKWPTTFKAKIIKESYGLVPTTELLDLMRNSQPVKLSGWDSDMSAILLLLHLLSPSAQGRKRPGKLSVYQVVDQLIRFQKVGTSVQQHLDNITQSSQPYFLAQGSTQSTTVTSMHFHARQQVQLELLTNSLKPFTSLVHHTFFPEQLFHFCENNHL